MFVCHIHTRIITCRTIHVTRHTSHVTLYTSHVTRHTSLSGIEEFLFNIRDLVKRFDVGDAGGV